MDKKRNRALIISIIINVLLALMALILILNKVGLLTRTSIVGEKYSYLSNSQYEANLSMFSIIGGDADIIFAGDSITAYGRFSEFFPEKKVMNRGIGSDTTEGLYNRMDEILSHNPKSIFIMIGINDMARNIQEDEAIRYYGMILSEIQEKNPECKIYVESVLPTRTIDLNVIQSYNNALNALCEDMNVEYIDLYSAFITDGEPNDEMFSADKVHLNGNGYKEWINEVRPMIYN